MKYILSAFATLLLLSPLTHGQMGAGGDDLPPLERVTIQEYFNRLSSFRNIVAALPPMDTAQPGPFDPNLSARDLLRQEVRETRRAVNEIAGLLPPDVVATEHYEVLQILESRNRVNHWIIDQTPADARASDRSHVYRTPEIGALRARLQQSNCAMDAIARQTGSAVRLSMNCGADTGAPELNLSTGRVLGSAGNPVTVIELAARAVPEGAGMPAPDLSFGFDTVYARAGTLTLVYDNQNPPPFEHNAVVYRNATGTNLRASEVVAGTPGGSGPARHSVEFRLEPGTYYIVCNVHLTLQQAKLIVVP